MKVTNETITDEQLNRLLVTWGSMAADVRLARGPTPQGPQRVAWEMARQRCADAWNTRAAARKG